MEGQSSYAAVPEGSGPTVTNNDQSAHFTNQEHSSEIDQSVDLRVLPRADERRQFESPDITSDMATSPPATPPQRQAADIDLNMTSQDQQNVGSRKPKVDESEAIKRGRSFGPLKKHGEKPSSIGGILKATAKSPPPRSRQRSLSQGSDVLQYDGAGGPEKDNYANDGDVEGAPDSEEDNVQADSSDDEVPASGPPRGRSGRGTSTLRDDVEKSAVTVTTSEGEKPASTSKRFHKGVRPTTSYDRKVSAQQDHEPHTSDSEEEDDIRRAQQLPLDEGAPDNSKAHRASQIIHRGDFTLMQREGKDGRRCLRTYLVATDLSEEAAYALEWTIGTILRDGDTLIAVYAVDEEVGTAKPGDSVPVGEGAKVMQEDTAEMEKTTAESSKRSLNLNPMSMLKAFPSSSRKSSANCSVDARAFSTAELERNHAIERLVKACVGYLRKTRLQVRVLVDVVHCKSPNRMIMECVSSSSCLIVSARPAHTSED